MTSMKVFNYINKVINPKTTKPVFSKSEVSGSEEIRNPLLRLLLDSILWSLLLLYIVFILAMSPFLLIAYIVDRVRGI